MDKIIHNKLVRDKIPEIISRNQEVPIERVLNHNDYCNELKKKLIDEANEVFTAPNVEKMKKEIADVLEVILRIAECI